MKLAILAALAAAFSFAADPTPAPPKPEVLATAALTEAEREKFLRLAGMREQIIATKQAELRLALLPYELEQNALFVAKCTALGVPKKDIGKQCNLHPDEDKGDGFGEVRWEKPVEPLPAVEAKSEPPATK